MDNIKKTKSNPMTSQQKEMLVDFISSRPEMYTGKLNPNYTKDKMKALWSELSSLLNSVPGGPAKQWQQWRKTWVDLKKNMKAKISTQNNYSIGTGGGPPLKIPKSSFEDKLYTIISPVSISGNKKVNESEVQVNPNNTEMCELETEMCEEADIIETDNIQAESQVERDGEEIINNDHYTNKESKIEEKSTRSIAAKRKRVTKTTRLTDSLRNNQKFLRLNEEDLESKQWYRQKKK